MIIGNYMKMCALEVLYYFSFTRAKDTKLGGWLGTHTNSCLFGKPMSRFSRSKNIVITNIPHCLVKTAEFRLIELELSGKTSMLAFMRHSD